MELMLSIVTSEPQWRPTDKMPPSFSLALTQPVLNRTKGARGSDADLVQQAQERSPSGPWEEHRGILKHVPCHLLTAIRDLKRSLEGPRHGLSPD